MNKHLYILALLMLSGCISEFDMQGTDPKEYYAEHPIVNRVGHKQATLELTYKGNVAHLDNASVKKLHSVRPEAVESLRVDLSPAMFNNVKRRSSIMRLAGQWGYDVPVEFEQTDAISDAQATLYVGYASIITPDCPDWKQSPVTNYSNMQQVANIGCATTNNLGLMLVDPRDIERGSSGGNINPDPNRNADAVRKYRTGLSSGSSSAARAAPMAMPIALPSSTSQ